jgi:hypothetical protein
MRAPRTSLLLAARRQLQACRQDSQLGDDLRRRRSRRGRRCERPRALAVQRGPSPCAVQSSARAWWPRQGAGGRRPDAARHLLPRRAATIVSLRHLHPDRVSDSRPAGAWSHRNERGHPRPGPAHFMAWRRLHVGRLDRGLHRDRNSNGHLPRRSVRPRAKPACSHPRWVMTFSGRAPRTREPSRSRPRGSGLRPTGSRSGGSDPPYRGVGQARARSDAFPRSAQPHRVRTAMFAKKARDSAAARGPRHRAACVRG